MLKTSLVVLGLGLVGLWIAELNTYAAPGWMTWLDLVAAASALLGAIGTRRSTDSSSRAAGPILISLGLFAVWILGLATGAMSSVVWWNFVFACAFLIVGIVNRPQARFNAATTISSDVPENPFRRSA